MNLHPETLSAVTAHFSNLDEESPEKLASSLYKAAAVLLHAAEALDLKFVDTMRPAPEPHEPFPHPQHERGVGMSPAYAQMVAAARTASAAATPTEETT